MSITISEVYDDVYNCNVCHEDVDLAAVEVNDCTRLIICRDCLKVLYRECSDYLTATTPQVNQ